MDFVNRNLLGFGVHFGLSLEPYLGIKWEVSPKLKETWRSWPRGVSSVGGGEKVNRIAKKAPDENKRKLRERECNGW